MNTAASTFLVFSDLDGSLLDHYSYSFEAALPAVQTLERSAIPLILASSKTCAEMLELRSELGNDHPFIVENGAAVFIPRNYFPEQPAETEIQGDYWVHALASTRSRWQELLATLDKEFPDAFESFHGVGVAGIMRMTGLSEDQASRANDRSYSEPVRWLGAAHDEARFIQRLVDGGATVMKGGRFLSVSDDCDKGKALIWLRELYRRNSIADTVKDLAIGDSDNDCPMLEAAEAALLIRSPVHGFPSLKKAGGVIHSDSFGPAGWAEGVLQWLHLNKLST